MGGYQGSRTVSRLRLMSLRRRTTGCSAMARQGALPRFVNCSSMTGGFRRRSRASRRCPSALAWRADCEIQYAASCTRLAVDADVGWSLIRPGMINSMLPAWRYRQHLLGKLACSRRCARQAERQRGAAWHGSRGGHESTLLSRQPRRDDECRGCAERPPVDWANTPDGGAGRSPGSRQPGRPTPPATSLNAVDWARQWRGRACDRVHIGTR